jgi:hypothetical protein
MLMMSLSKEKHMQFFFYSACVSNNSGHAEDIPWTQDTFP